MTSSTLMLLQAALQTSIRQEIKQIAEEEIKEAEVRTQERIHDLVDRMALKLASEYCLERRGTEIIITVKKAV